MTHCAFFHLLLRFKASGFFFSFPFYLTRPSPSCCTLFRGIDGCWFVLFCLSLGSRPVILWLLWKSSTSSQHSCCFDASPCSDVFFQPWGERVFWELLLHRFCSFDCPLALFYDSEVHYPKMRHRNDCLTLPPLSEFLPY